MPGDSQYSLERVFEEMRLALPLDQINWSVHTSPRRSQGIWPRIANLSAAYAAQQSISHITGDVQYLGIALRGRQTVLTVADCVSLHRLRGWRRRLLKWMWYDIPVRKARIVCAISAATRDELLRETHCNPSKVRVVHCCSRPEFTSCPREFNSVAPTVLIIGTSENKNILRCFEALEGIPCHVRILGRLNEQHLLALKQFRVQYVNTVGASNQEVVEAYRHCDLVLFPSTYEGFGLPIIEANATGRPVVTSTVTSMPEVAGEAACLVDPYDVSAIRSGIERVIRDSPYRRQLVAAGYENVKRFAPSEIARQYLEIYREIAEGSCSRPCGTKTVAA